MSLGSPKRAAGLGVFALCVLSITCSSDPVDRVASSPIGDVSKESSGHAAGTPRFAPSSARVELPRYGSGLTRVADVASPVAVAFALETARPVFAEQKGNVVRFSKALGDGVDMSYRVSDDGAEDFVRFERKPDTESIAYRIELDAVAGLRLVANSLEMLDAGGVPRLRVAAPYVTDARGEPSPARLDLAGCDADRDARAPWGRPVVAPGALSCRVLVHWGSAVGASLTYPVVVDPAWTSTAKLALDHTYNSQVVLPNGRVLVAGGTDAGAELYDPATGTWANTGAASIGRRLFGMALLADGKVLVAGGYNPQGQPLASAETYDPASGTWSTVGSLSSSRAFFPLVRLTNGKVLAAGGSVSATSETYDPTSRSWTPSGAMSTSRLAHTSSRLPDGRVLVAGGRNFPSSAFFSTTEIFDPSTAVWSAGPSMSDARLEHTATSLADGRVLITGGANNLSYVATTEIYDPKSNLWTPTAPMKSARVSHMATLLPDGRVMSLGGRLNVYIGFSFNPQFVPLNSTELYDPILNKWTDSGAMPSGRAYAGVATLPGGTVLVSGGIPLGERSKSAEVFRIESLGSSGRCTGPGECASGFCVDGVCCDRACDSACTACSSATKGRGVDGVCEPVAAGLDLKGDCPTLPATTCAASGVCDGAGACALYTRGTLCGASRCTEGVENALRCDGSGSCVDGATPCAPYTCRDAVSCGALACQTSAECSATFVCNPVTRTCGVPSTTCDGAHTVYAPDGTPRDCTPYSCQGETCRAKCGSGLDCAAGYACNRDYACVDASSALRADDSFGLFGCAVRPQPRSSPWGTLAFAAWLPFVGIVARRYRRGQRPLR